MIWNICFPLSLATLLAGSLIATRLFRQKNTQNNETKGFFALAITVFVSLTEMYYALEYTAQYHAEPFGWLTAILVAMRDTIGTFVVDGDFSFFGENMQGMAEWMVPVCSVVMALMIIAAPVFTFGFLLSFFKNLSSMLRFSLRRNADVFVFSELNEKSLVLASDLKANNDRRVIVFCDVFENDDENLGELLSEAKRINAIFFEKDILDVDFKKHTKKGSLYFYITGEDDVENVNQTLGLIRAYGDAENANLYLFSNSASAELLLFDGKKHKMKIRRVNESLSLIQKSLYDQPTALFESARDKTPEGDTLISAVIVGLGDRGTEMLKTLLWYGQMDGYRVQIDAFDRDAEAEQRIRYQCPEIMSEEYNGVYVPGEAYYKVDVHGGINVGTDAFAKEIAKLTSASFVLVSLGNDDLNIATAADLRMMFERMHIKPVICAVVHNSDLCACLSGLTNFKDQAYDIRWIGSLEDMYSEAVIMHSTIEKDALKIHQSYGGTEQEFFSYEYNYRSSTASALHNRARAKLEILGAHLPPEQRSEEQKQALKMLEHRRWNAYMRAEGYVYSGSTDESSRNDLAKMHHDLVAYAFLAEEEKHKDRRIGTN